MKYVDRTQAKSKYKKILLATAATFTLGMGTVSTLGGVASVYAAEEQKPSTSVLGYIKMLKNKDEKVRDGLNNAGSVLTQLYADAYQNNGNFNDTFRNLGILSTGMIPYVGAFISPLLDLIWPSSAPSIEQQLQAMEERLANLMDEKISIFDEAGLSKEIKGMMENLAPFENSINGKVQYSPPANGVPADVDSLNQSRAVAIEHSFQRLIEISSKPGFEEAELPIYTIIATAHINFLKFMEKNGTSPKINFTSNAVKDFLQNMQKDQTEYKKHIEETYKQGEAKIDKKIISVANQVNKVLLPSGGAVNQFNKSSVEQAISKYQKEYNEKIQTKPSNNTTTAQNKWQNELDAIQNPLNTLKDGLKQYNDLTDKKNDYYEKTAGSIAFKVAVGSMTVEEAINKIDLSCVTTPIVTQHTYDKPATGSITDGKTAVNADGTFNNNPYKYNIDYFATVVNHNNGVPQLQFKFLNKERVAGFPADTILKVKVNNKEVFTKSFKDVIKDFDDSKTITTLNSFADKVMIELTNSQGEIIVCDGFANDLPVIYPDSNVWDLVSSAADHSVK